jgi:hypothetical protein
LASIHEHFTLKERIPSFHLLGGWLGYNDRGEKALPLSGIKAQSPAYKQQSYLLISFDSSHSWLYVVIVSVLTTVSRDISKSLEK